MTALAADLDDTGTHRALCLGLAGLVGPASSMPDTSARPCGRCANEPDTAWRAWAASVLAEELDARTTSEPRAGKM